MTFVVGKDCINCKHTTCVQVCPVDCFYEGKNILVIDPEECIDCGLCEPECPIEAIYADDELPNNQIEFIEINAKLADVYENITEAKEPLPDADNFKNIEDKKKFLNIGISNEDTIEDIKENSNTILLYDNGEIVINNSKFKIDELSNTDNIIFENTLLDNLNKRDLVCLNVEGKAYHEWAMKIMEFLQKNEFIDVQIKTLK